MVSSRVYMKSAISIILKDRIVECFVEILKEIAVWGGGDTSSNLVHTYVYPGNVESAY